MHSRTLKRQTEWIEEPKFSSILDSESDAEFLREEKQQLSTSQLTPSSSAPLTKGNMITRIIAGIGMVCAFCTLFCIGFLPVAAFILMLQFLIFKELIAIAHSPSQERKLPWFRSLTWFFLICTTYHLYGEAVFSFVCNSLSNGAIVSVVAPLADHHNFISFLLHSLGIVAFVLNLKRGHYRFQFRQLGFALIVLLVAFYQTKCFYNLLFQGKFWIILPCSLVIMNDTIAYFCGKAFGRTLLMKISPKKTVEGFVGGFVGTLIWAFLFSRFLLNFPSLLCPYNSTVARKCNFPFVEHFQPFNVALGSLWAFKVYPIQIHALIMAAFASLIAPFGGFFASGFKRANKMKDFAASIPGHGGVTDRMDCQLIMGLFSYLYIESFLKKEPIVDRLFELVMRQLNREQVGELVERLIRAYQQHNS